MPSEKLLTRMEVAELLKVHVNTVDKYRKSGRLTEVILGFATIRFRQSDVDAMVARSLKSNAAPEHAAKA